MPAALMEYADFSEFQEALKNLRKTDDIIINTINAAVPTDSFHADPVAACKDLHENLEQGNLKREKLIKNCIIVTADRAKKFEKQREANLDDIQLKKQLRANQTKLKMLQVELSIEDIDRQRTAKVFSEKCRKFFKPL